MKPSLSVIVPALNEEPNLGSVIDNIKYAVEGNIGDYEILIFNDGSTDNTAKIADKIAQKDKHVKVIHNKKNRGIGYCFRKGVKLVDKEYVIFIPGDNELHKGSIKKLLGLIKMSNEDIIIPYVVNKELRPIHRRLISELFTSTLNTLFNLRLKYYLGENIYKTNMIKKINMTTNSFAYQAEILVKLLKSGHSYTEIETKMQKRTGKSKMFKIKNIVGVIKTVFTLVLEIYFLNKELYHKNKIDR